MATHGIVAYGAYIPRWRLNRSSISDFTLGGLGSGSRAVASFDENTTTMGVEASRIALSGYSEKINPNSLWFSTVSPAYMDKTNAANIHSALNFDDDVSTMDYGTSVHSALGAFRNALEKETQTLLVTSDIRIGPSGSSEESLGGDASTALITGTDENGLLLAEYLGGVSFTADFLDRWRSPENRYSQTWEERFGESVYKPVVLKAWERALELTGIRIEEIDQTIITGLHSRAVTRTAPELNVQVKDDLVDVIGNSGAAHPSVLICDYLDKAKPEKVFALLVLADGCDVFFFRTTENLKKRKSSRPISEQIENQLVIPYSKYLSWRGLLENQLPNRPAPNRPSAAASHRRSKWKMGFFGSKDLTTGIIHMPPSRIGIKGGVIDDMEIEPMSAATGTIETFTTDHLVYSPNSPVIFAVVNFEGGGRIPIELTDTEPDKVKIGDHVEMTFRCLYTSEGIQNYFWKAKPYEFVRG